MHRNEYLSLSALEKAQIAEELILSLGKDDDADLEYAAEQCRIMADKCKAEDAFQDGLDSPANIAYNAEESQWKGERA